MLDAGLWELGLEPGTSARASLVRFVELLVRWNRTYNLTGVRQPEEMVTRHLLDALAAVAYTQGARCLDVGTGAGLPGLVMAICRPELQWVLLDSDRKKTRFCLQAVTELGLQNVTIAHCRAERYQPAQLFETVIARAFGSIAQLIGCARRVLVPKGRVLAMKGRFPEKELAELGAMQDNARVVALRVPGLDAQRHLVIVDMPARTGSCPIDGPREVLH